MLRKSWNKVLLFTLSLLPLCWVAWRYWRDDLTANPIEYITHFTGDWTIRFLVLTLAITPLRKSLKLPELIRFRRAIGLFAFFYGCLHFSIYLGVDKFFDFHEIWGDIAKRPYIIAGFTGFALMIPLAITSTKGWIRRLGGKHWQWLHRLVYVSATAGVVHYYWLVKSDIRQPLVYGILVGVLLGFRGVAWGLGRTRKHVPVLTTAHANEI
jgi:methionine sulfoxide reductase heme-binding subunit